MKPLRIYCSFIVEEPGNLWHRQLGSTLRRMGHTVFVPPVIGLRDSWILHGAGVWGRRDRERLTSRLLADIQRIHESTGLDLVFVYLYPFQFTTRLFTELTAKSIPSLYFFCDNHMHPEVAATYAPSATLNWVPEIEAVPQFHASRSAFVHLPMAANPDVNFPTERQEDVQVAFAGTKNPYRRHLLGPLLHADVGLQVFGDGWYSNAESYHNFELERSLPQIAPGVLGRTIRYLRWKRNAVRELLTNGRVRARRGAAYAKLGAEHDEAFRAVANRSALSAESVNAVFSRAAVTVGINDQFIGVGKTPVVLYAKLREFEATMSGACYLTQQTPELPGLFDEGKEVMSYRTCDELIDKARFLLANPSVRQSMRVACLKRARAQHDWAHRFTAAFQHLGLQQSS